MASLSTLIRIARRPVRLHNPMSRSQKIGLAVAGTVALATTGYYALREKPRAKRGALPSNAAKQTPDGMRCDMGPRYPGFMPEGDVCGPGPTTPPGIYVHSGCTDFAFVPGDGSEQTDLLEEMLAAAAASGANTDPTHLATELLKHAWPECSWPPAASAPQRIVQLYMALGFILGRQLWNLGGTPLDATTPDEVDEAVAGRLAELGLEVFQPELVPELELPDLDERPAVAGFDTNEPPPEGGEGPGLIEPGPKQGQIVPDGGLPMPGGKPPPANCELTPYTTHSQKSMTPLGWWQRYYYDVSLMTPFAPCDEYELVVGVCIKTPPGATYGLFDNVFVPGVIADEKYYKNVKYQYTKNAAKDYSDLRLAQIRKYALFTKLKVEGDKTIVENDNKFVELYPAIDPCPDAVDNGTNSTFDIIAHNAAGETAEVFWNPRMSLRLVAEGKTVVLRVWYSGLPFFELQNGGPYGGTAVASLNKKTGYIINVKVWAKGKA